MKINGRKLEGPNVAILVIPRPDYEVTEQVQEPDPENEGKFKTVTKTVSRSGDITFKAQAILDSEEFDKLVPMPKPPFITRPGQEPYPDFKDAKYSQAISVWSAKRTNWTIIKSLAASTWLEWETVDLHNPETWANWSEELKQAGFSEIERAKISNLVVEANGMDESKYKEARERFLAGQGRQ